MKAHFVSTILVSIQYSYSQLILSVLAGVAFEVAKKKDIIFLFYQQVTGCSSCNFPDDVRDFIAEIPDEVTFLCLNSHMKPPGATASCSDRCGGEYYNILS